jgi:hypothetical protein
MEGKSVVIPLVWPITQDGALVSDAISLKNYNHADIYIQIGTVTKAGAVTLQQGKAVASVATALPFTRYLSTGFILDYDGASVDTPAAAGETVTGAGGGIGYVARDLGGRLECYAFNGTTFVDNEVLTFSGGKTAVANGIQKNEDIMIPRTAALNTFDCAAVANKQYCIPVNGSMLTEGYDCVEVNIADMDATGVVAFAVLSEPRYLGDPPETAIYD